MDINYIATTIFALSTVAILSLDLGVDYNKNEIKVYQHPLFQLMAILSGVYLNVTDFRSGFFVFSFWVILKYFTITPLKLM